MHDLKTIDDATVREHLRPRKVAALRIQAWFIVLLVPLFGLLDYVVIPSHLRLSLTLRLVVVVYAGAIILLDASRWSEIIAKHVTWFAVSSMIAVAWSIAVMCWMHGGYESPYYAGLGLAALAGYLIALPLRQSILTYSVFYLFYLGPLILGVIPVRDLAVALSNQMFLVSTIIITIAFQQLRDRLEANEIRNVLALREAQSSLAQVNEQLKSVDELKDQFFANISHELRTPLTLSIGPLERALSEGKSGDDGVWRLQGEEAHQTLSIVHRNQLRLAKLINDLLDFSKLSAGKTEFYYRCEDVSRTVRYLSSTLEAATRDRGISLTFESDADICELYVDHDAFEKIVMNLLSNAFKFTPDGGRIEIRLHSVEDSRVTLEVTDTGIGIPEDKLPAIFERFRQVDASATRRYAGTGIGLSMVKEYVELHGGTVTVKSTLGQGTTFLVEFQRGFAHLPAERVERSAMVHTDAAAHDSANFVEFLGDDDQSAIIGGPPALDGRAQSGSVEMPLGSQGRSAISVGTESTASAPRASVELVSGELGRSLAPAPSPFEDLSDTAIARIEAVKASLLDQATVLVVDDTTDMRRYIRSLLAPYYRVVTARDGQEGLDKARGLAPDLIISDVMMPRMSGDELCRRVKQDRGRLGRTPVMLVTAKMDDQGKLEALASGADDYLFKPFNSVELQLRVKNLLREHQKEQALIQAHVELTQTHKQLESLHQHIEDDLGEARRFQQAILNRIDTIAGLEVAARTEALHHVGGDLYDVTRLSDKHVRILLLDVTGHGVQAALRTIAIRGEYDRIKMRATSVADVMRSLNNALLAQYRGIRIICTGCCVDIVVERGVTSVHYASAAHIPLLIKRGYDIQSMHVEGAFLGVMPDIDYTYKTFALASGDELVMYTDGIEDQPNPAGERFEEVRVRQALQAASSPEETVVCLLSAVESFAGGAAQFDDRSIIAIQAKVGR